jgi:hypothetical protein
MEFAMNHEIERVKIVVYPDGRLDSENAARFLGFSPKTLAMMRTAGTGPKFVKRGPQLHGGRTRTHPQGA